MAGVSQPAALSAFRQRARALLGSADLTGARDVLEHAVEVGKGAFGEDDPEVLVTLHQLARLHMGADDPAAARRVLEEAYAAGQWRLGDTDPLMLQISFDLGLVAEELGNRHEARKAFTRVAGTGADVLGADHWAVLRARAYLGGDPTNQLRAEPAQPQDRIPYGDPQPAVQHRPVQRPTPVEHAEPVREHGTTGQPAPIRQQALVQPVSIQQAPAPHTPVPRQAQQRQPAHTVHHPALDEPTV